MIQKLSNILEIELYVIEMALSILVIGIALLFVANKKNRLRYGAVIALTVYVFVILYSTVFARPQSNTHEYNFNPFWSYAKIGEGWDYLLRDNIFNVLLFIPIGFLLYLVLIKNKISYVFSFGIGLSLIIEASQFFLMKGFSEIDDIIHNTVGCLIGYVLCYFVVKTCRFFINLFRSF